MHEGLDRADIDDPALGAGELSQAGMRDVENPVEGDHG